jgi:hypothetical protein
VAAPKRTSFQREHDLRLVANLYLQGKTQVEIAQRFELSKVQICYDIKEIRRRWRESGLIDYNEKKHQELARIDLIEQHAWAAWERSCRDKEVHITSSEDGSRPRNKAEVRKSSQAGDPRFLERISWCVEQRCKIFGLYAQPYTITVPIVQQTNVFANVPDYELERLEKEMDAVIARWGIKETPSQPLLPPPPPNGNGKDHGEGI